MLRKTAVISLLAASLLVTGCDDDDDEPDTVTGPEALVQVGNSTEIRGPVVTINPLIITSQFFGFGGPCPAVQPFGGRANVVVLAGNNSVVLTNRMSQPQITLPMPVPTTQFGTALVEARSTRIFPFDFRFGCNSTRSGTAVFIVTTRDSRGTSTTSQVKATIN
jgi:hypothetical protein